jgi:hypothetical protein
MTATGVQDAAAAAGATEALTKWAPIVKFDSKEQYFPSSVDWFLGRADLLDSTGAVVAQPATSAAMADSYPGQKSEYNLSIHDDGKGTLDTTRAGVNPQSNPAVTDLCAYAFARPVPNSSSQTDLIYYFFYPFNGDVLDEGKLAAIQAGAAGAIVVGALTLIFGVGYVVLGAGVAATTIAAKVAACGTPGVNHHEGDWECVIVRVDGPLTGTTALREVYYSQHSGGEWVQATGVELSDDGRPVVYSARNSHANYPKAGSDADRAGGLCPEYYDGGAATAWDTKSGLVEIDWDAAAFTGVAWNEPGIAARVSKPTSGLAVACDDDDFAVTVETKGDDLHCRTGSVGDFGYLSFPTETVHFDRGNNPSVALGGDGLVVSVHQGLDNHGLWINVGAIDETDASAPKVDWWKDSHGNVATQLLPSGSGDKDTAVVVGSDGTVVAAIAGSRQIRITVVSIDPAALGNPATNPVGTIPATPATTFPTAVSTIAMARNADGTILLVGETDNSVLRTWVGQLNGSQITWLSPAAGTPITQPSGQMVSGHSPVVVISGKSKVVVTAMSGSHAAFAITGTLTITDSTPALLWADGALPTFVSPKEAVGLTTIPSQILVCACYRDNSTSYMRSLPGEFVDPNAFGNWTPGEQWLKFSGRWGKDGTGVIIDVQGTTIRCRESGPTGIPLKSIWFASPGDH